MRRCHIWFYEYLLLSPRRSNDRLGHLATWLTGTDTLTSMFVCLVFCFSRVYRLIGATVSLTLPPLSLCRAVWQCGKLSAFRVQFAFCGVVVYATPKYIWIYNMHFISFAKKLQQFHFGSGIVISFINITVTKYFEINSIRLARRGAARSVVRLLSMETLAFERKKPNKSS